MIMDVPAEFSSLPWTNTVSSHDNIDRDGSFSPSSNSAELYLHTPPGHFTTPDWATPIPLSAPDSSPLPLGVDRERDYTFIQALFGANPIDPFTPLHIRQNTWPLQTPICSSPSPNSYVLDLPGTPITTKAHDTVLNNTATTLHGSLFVGKPKDEALRRRRQKERFDNAKLR
ncbi:hypothetical protein VKT23_004775 [Stygiomarasmius scandens]|uniref:BZIP domain-containing protein n=1 Tax=Marasmiellus scandens TaxID=2682957 RepID=A0ABR1JUH4_9AGAR